MSQPIAIIEPSTITAGDTVQWYISLADYPATEGWTLKYALVSAAAVLAIASTASDSDHLVTLSASTTAAYAASDYTYQKYVEKGIGAALQRVTLDSGLITIVKPLTAVTAPTDTRSSARRALDAVTAAIEGRASRTDLKYEIHNGASIRKIESFTAEQLLTAQNKLTLIVWREMNPGRLCPQINISMGGYRG